MQTLPAAFPRGSHQPGWAERELCWGWKPSWAAALLLGAAQLYQGVTSLTAGWWSPACHGPTLTPQAAPRSAGQGF